MSFASEGEYTSLDESSFIDETDSLGSRFCENSVILDGLTYALTNGS